MAVGKEGPLWRFKWHIAVIYIALPVVDHNDNNALKHIEDTRFAQ